MPAFENDIARTLGGLLVYLGMMGALCGVICLGVLALASPGLLIPSKVTAYGAPTRVRSPVIADDATADTPQTYRIGPPVVHRGPQPPSQAEIAKANARETARLRLKASERELQHSQRELQRHSDRPGRASVPPAEAEHHAAPEPTPVDARHSGNF